MKLGLRLWEWGRFVSAESLQSVFSLLLFKHLKMTKEKVLETVRSLPDEFTLDELLERLFILEVIEKGMQQVKEGQVVSSEDARKRFEKWLR